MNTSQNYEADFSFEMLEDALSPGNTYQFHQGSEQKVLSGSPEESFNSIPCTLGASPSASSVVNPSGLSTSSPPYLQRASPSRYSIASPTRVSPVSPSYLTRSSPLYFSEVSATSISSVNPSYPPCASPPHFSRTSPSGFSGASPPHFPRSSPLGFSGASPQNFSGTSSPGFSYTSPSGRSSSESGTNNPSECLNLAVALADTNQRAIVSPYDNNSHGHEARERSSPYATSAQMYEQTFIPRTQYMAGASSTRHVANITSMNTASYCPANLHDDTRIRYCLTCSQPFCEDCSIAYHGNGMHSYVNFVDFFKQAIQLARETMHKARDELSVLQNDLEDVRSDAEMLDQKAKEAALDVMICLQRLSSAMEIREKELLNKIEAARVLKFAALKAKGEHMQNHENRLRRATYKLYNALKSCNLASNPKDLLAIKDMTLAEIFQIDQNRRYQYTREENWISFTSTANNLQQQIASLGNIVTNNPGPIGEGRMICGNNSSQLYYPYSTFPLKQIGRGCAVPGSSLPVSVSPRSTIRGRQQQHKVLQVIGDNGDAADNLCRPWGVTCDNRGHIIVADRSNNRIQIYNEDGIFVMRFGSYGTGPCQFDRPAGVAVDSRQRIIVADKDNHRIQILQMDGTFVHCFGQKGVRCGQFNYPWDVAVNSECQIAVSDTRNHRVQLFSPDGIFLCKYGYETTSSMWKYFDSPRGVSFTPEGNLITTDFNNHNLVIVDSSFLNARTIVCEAVDGSARAILRPQGLVIDDYGNIVVADSRNHRVQVFDSTGRFLWKYGGTHGTGTNDMDRPAGVAVLPNGKVAIVDFGNNRVLLLGHVYRHRQ